MISPGPMPIGGLNAQSANQQTEACIIDPWPWQWPQTVPPQSTWPPVPTYQPSPEQHTHYHFTPQTLSDEDVERIAKRVAELLKGA